MGKETVEIEKGKCACSECDDFMRSDGANCAYCSSFPNRHSKNEEPFKHQNMDGHGLKEMRFL